MNSETVSDESGRGEYLAILRMGDANCVNHLRPIAQSVRVSRLHVSRPGPQPEELEDDLINYIEAGGRTRVSEVLRTFVKALTLAARVKPKGIVSFNGVPYGVIAVVVGALLRVPVHVGFVGTEAYHLERKRSTAIFDRLLRRAALVTVPGPSMGESLAHRGYDNRRIRELPHSVDTTRFEPPPEGATRDIDVLFVGALIQRKQVDRIVQAVPMVVSERGDTSVCIVGDGPLRAELESQARALDVGDVIQFAGFQSNPADWFRRSRLIAITSWWEGFPFVLVEAMCTGAIPVATRVGSIADIIDHGRNGYLLDSDEPEAVARAFVDVLSDATHEEALRAAALGSRARFSYSAATELWTEWLAAL